MFNIDEELKKLPKSPGVYLMHDKNGEIIYVGKAKNLFNRVHQYFQKVNNRTQKIEIMISNIDYFEVIVVDNELESLILEANLIKENKPRYNTLLKDDKNYPYIKITIYEEYPRILFVRSKSNDKSIYFGPFKSTYDVREVLDLVKKTYKIRSCNIPIKKNSNAKRECLYYHLGYCIAPCINKNIKNEYDNNIKSAISFLNGKYEDTLLLLDKQMEKLSLEEEYEDAAKIRDLIFSIRNLKEKQKINQNNFIDKDIIGLYKEDEYASLQIFILRDGKIIDRISKIMSIDKEDKSEEILQDFIKQFYNDSPFIPNEIFIPIKLKEDENDLLEKWLSKNKKKKTHLLYPIKGNNAKLINLTNTNAKISLKQFLEKNKKKEDSLINAIQYLKNVLNIDSLHRIESYDISNISGTNSVGSMVCFIDGKMSKKDYRKFKIRNVLGPNDYLSIKEVIERRIGHLNAENYPNLLLIDGGMQQVNVTKKVLEEHNISIPICGMVKDDKHRTRGLLFNNKEVLFNNSQYNYSKEAFKLITNIQDETHRFAISYHKLLRSKEQIHSILDDIKYVGNKKKISLIKHFKSIENIKNASMEELLLCENIDKRAALSIFSYFKK
ncbi:MAG: excinuclease ABC subunit UvrC [Eubacteriales bacterium]|nr:excinuclease ABC subunit UvrC [Eubacteriales bacterium]